MIRHDEKKITILLYSFDSRIRLTKAHLFSINNYMKYIFLILFQPKKKGIYSTEFGEKVALTPDGTFSATRCEFRQPFTDLSRRKEKIQTSYISIIQPALPTELNRKFRKQRLNLITKYNNQVRDPKIDTASIKSRYRELIENETDEYGLLL